MNSDSLAKWRTLFADRFAETAQWRRLKAEEWPDDARNVRSARALEWAAVRMQDDDVDLSPLRVLEGFDGELSDWGQAPEWDSPLTWAGEETTRILARFGFDNVPREPDDRDLGVFLEHVVDALLHDWREMIAAGTYTPPRSLVQLFQGCGVGLYEDEEEADDA